ncbi:DUF3037 domain-containing protein [Lactobacillus apis]|uniref:DUF3037 domain-containing protein n=1 Tax=Lactobacillus apis TaxID=303541 RepID=UPI00242F097C|nr:DUF3037 domain-containing protein [Lactobacillus apis]
MAHRENYWYSIISYIPSSIRYERINVGAILGNKSNSLLKFKLLPSTSRKIQSFVWNSTEKKEYSVANELLEFLVNRNYKEPSLLNTPSNNGQVNWNKWLNATVPSGMVFSDVHFARTADPDMIFNDLIEEYVGKQFFKTNDHIITLQENVEKYFKEENLLDQKLKRNLLISPSKTLPLTIKMDYAYLSQLDNKIGLVQVPNVEHINTWYERIYTFLNKADSDNFHLNIILGENDYNNDSQQVQPFVDEFDKSKNVSKVLVPRNSNQPLKKLAKDIENSTNVDEWKAKDFLEYIA